MATRFETEKTTADLEWERIESAVAARCKGPLAHRLRLQPASDLRTAERAQAELRELFELFTAEGELPLHGLRDIDSSLERAARGGVLDALSLRDVGMMLAAGKTLRNFLRSHATSLPLLRESCNLAPSLDELADDIGHAIDADGTVSDRASPELRRLRAEAAAARSRIVSRLEQMLHDKADILQDGFITEREGRFVLPVRRDAHERLEGIVHGTSASGASIFVEPRAVIGLGNQLKMAQGEILREEERILSSLSTRVAEELFVIRAACDALNHADLRQACARFGRDIGAVPLQFEPSPILELHSARHPILLLDRLSDETGQDRLHKANAAVVPFSLSLSAARGLVISGPNAGGKTVALKTIGLAALMMRCGLPIAAHPESRVGFFSNVLSDVGDDQSLQKNVSTFSAHVTHLREMLEASDGQTLVLLDELAGGTDPEEGAALACAVVDGFLRRGAAVATTTHYEPLKAFAARDPRLVNAAVGFDVERMRPTFTLHIGSPGASSALAIASRFGIPEAIVSLARDILPKASAAVSDLARELEEQRHAIAVERTAMADRAAALRASERAHEEREARARTERMQKLDQETERVREQLRKVREELKNARKSVREASSMREIEAARQKLEAATLGLAPEPVPVKQGRPDGLRSVGDEELAIGEKVYVARLGTFAEVLEVKAGEAKVSAGALRLWVKRSELERHSPGPKPKSSSFEAPAVARAKRPMVSDNTIDIRGMRADDAIQMVETYLDRLFGRHESMAYIQHGEGTGALRDAVRRWLKQGCAYTIRFDDASREDGGHRITMVELLD